jgi:hypothetical protein
MPSGFHTWSQNPVINATADTAINWAEGQSPSSVNDSSRAEMSVLAKWRDDNNGSLATAGATDYTLTTNTVFTSLALMDKQTLAFTMNVMSGPTPTLNVDGLGAKPIRNATGVALPAGALLSGSVYHATYYNTAGEWLIQNQPGAFGAISAGAVSAASVAAAGAMLSSSPSGGVGYQTGAGGAVSQTTSKSTAVTLNTICGRINMTSSPLASNTSVSFTVNNSRVAAADVVVINIGAGATASSYLVDIDAVAAGSFVIHIRNVSAGSLSEAVALNFAVIKVAIN